MNGHDGVVKILLKHNATVSKVDSDTRNVLDTAIHYGQTSVKVSLIKHIAVNGFCVYIHCNDITNFQCQIIASDMYTPTFIKPLLLLLPFW